MSEHWVDTIATRDGTDTTVNKVAPADNDDSLRLANTSWVRTRITAQNTDNAASSAEVTAGTEAEKYVSPATVQYITGVANGSTNLTTASMFTFDGTGAAGALATAWEEGNTHTISKNETGSYNITLTNAMDDASRYYVSVMWIQNGSTVQVGYSIQDPTTTTFTIVLDTDEAVNIDFTDIRVKITGKLA